MIVMDCKHGDNDVSMMMPHSTAHGRLKIDTTIQTYAHAKRDEPDTSADQPQSYLQPHSETAADIPRGTGARFRSATKYRVADRRRAYL